MRLAKASTSMDMPMMNESERPFPMAQAQRGRCAYAGTSERSRLSARPRDGASELESLRIDSVLGSDFDHPDANLLNNLEPSTRLFRFLPTCRLLQLVLERQFMLARPSKWADPFENFLSKTTFVLNGESIGFNLTDDFFGQCWTLREECDGLWRNYCGKNLDSGVRIETTAEKLLRAIWNGRDRFASLRTFVGKVVYLDDEELKGVLQGCMGYGHWLTSPNGDGMAQTLLMKRTEFEYEHEVRALVSDPDHADDHKPIPIKPNDFIDSVMFAPKVADKQQEECIDHLVAAGFDQSKILVARSTLYDPWRLEIC